MPDATDESSLRLPATITPLIEASGDLTSLGSMGDSKLIVSADAVYRVESTPAGEQVVAQYSLADLSDPKVEDWVDAVSLQARRGDRYVELLRGTTAKGLIFANAQKKLKALLDGKPVPPIEDILRLCPRCARPLPEDTNVCPACVNRGKTLLRLFEFTKPYKFRLIWACILVLLGTITALLPPYLTRHLIDDVLTDRKVHLFGWFIGALVLTTALGNLIMGARNRNTAYLSRGVTIDIRGKLFHKLQQLSMGFYESPQCRLDHEPGHE